MTENRTRKNADAAEETAVAETKPNKKSLTIKILLVAVILIAIAAIWFVKNTDTTKEASGQAAEQKEVVESSDAATTENQYADFALEADSIDLSALSSYQLPIVIDFGSDSCVPCQQMEPVLKSANADYQGKAIVKFVDVWKNTDAANGFPIQVIPSQVFINADGTPYTPSKDLDVEFTFYSSRDTQEHLFTVHQGGLTLEQLQAILADMGAGE